MVIDDGHKAGVLEVMKGLQLLFGKSGTEVSNIAATFAMNTIFVKHTCGIGAFVRPCLLCHQEASVRHQADAVQDRGLGQRVLTSGP